MDYSNQNNDASINVETEDALVSIKTGQDVVDVSEEIEIIEEIPEKIDVEHNAINNLSENNETKEEIVEQDVVDQAKSMAIEEVNDRNILTIEQNIVNIERPVEQPLSSGSIEMHPEIRAQLEKYLETNGVRNYNINIESGSNVGDNMLGVIAKVKITGNDKTGSNTELNWIVKIAPDAEMLRLMIDMHALYKNEAMIYETVFPIFKELEKDKSIVHGFDAYPQFLFSYMVPLKETIVMQDMKALGYVLRNKKEPLNLDHVKLVMKTYGKFHALSYAFKYSNPDLFQSLGAKLADTFENAVNVGLMKQAQQVIMDNAKLLLDPVIDSLAFKKYSKYADNFMDIYLNACMTTNAYSIICHGDSWINNMLFKYDNLSNPDIPTNVCLLDFQIARFASPVSDLSYFLFTCTSKAFRDEHYDNMIQLYYYTLCGHLNDLGFDPEKCLSYDALQAEIKQFSIIGLYMSLLALIAMTKDSEEITDWETHENDDEQKMLATKSKSQEDYNERIRNIIIEFTQRGYFDFLF